MFWLKALIPLQESWIVKWPYGRGKREGEVDSLLIWMLLHEYFWFDSQSPGDHPNITSAYEFGLGMWVQKMAIIFADVLCCIYADIVDG